MIKVEELTKRYDGFLALSGISFEIGRGEIVGFLGPNGAGKSTTLRILTGFLSPSSGNAWLDGHSTFSRQPQISITICWKAAEHPEMSVMDYLSS